MSVKSVEEQEKIRLYVSGISQDRWIKRSTLHLILYGLSMQQINGKFPMKKVPVHRN